MHINATNVHVYLRVWGDRGKRMKIEERIREKNRELVSSIYDGVLDPSQYQQIFHLWDEHFAAISDKSRDHQLSDFEWAQEFAEHFLKAGEFFDRIGGNNEETLQQSIDKSPYATLVCDASKRVISSNSLADQTFDRTLEHISQLQYDAESEKTLNGLFETLQRGSTDLKDQNVIVRVFPESGSEPVVILTDVISSEEFEGQTEDALYIHMRVISASWHEKVEIGLKAAFSLSNAELELVKYLHKGGTIKDISKWTGRSEPTLRTQLSSVLGKTSTKSQVGLSRMVASLVHLLGESGNLSESTKPSTLKSLTDLQSRNAFNPSPNVSIEWVESGDLNGTPVYFIQTTTWPTLTDPIVRELKSCGIRLISPMRSGVAGTTDVGLSCGPAEWAQLHRALIEHIGLSDLVIGGHTSGGVYALHLAQHLGKKCKGVFLADVGAPFKNAFMINQMPLAPRRLFLAARFFPIVLRTPYKLVHRDFYSGVEGEKRAVQYFYEGSPADEAIVNQGDYWQITRDNIDYVLRNYQQGLKDVCHWSADHTDHLLRVVKNVPVHYFQGEDNLLHRPEHIYRLTEECSNISYNIVPGYAQLLLFARPDLFSESMHQFCKRCKAQ